MSFSSFLVKLTYYRWEYCLRSHYGGDSTKYFVDVTYKDKPVTFCEDASLSEDQRGVLFKYNGIYHDNPRYGKAIMDNFNR
jgi:hypothetical protein